MKQIFFFLLVVVGVFSQCSSHFKCGDCLGDTANSCVWCDTGSSGMCAASTCAFGTTVSSAANCPAYCSDYAKCDSCTTTGASLNCSWCNLGVASTCMVDSTCTAASGTATPAGSCPPTCEAAPAVGTFDHCNFPSGYMIPSSVSYGAFYNSCLNYGLGYNTTSSGPSNCSDACTAERQTLPKACYDALMQLQCLAICPTCDNNYDISLYKQYGPCQSYCDAVNTNCNNVLSAGCKIDVSSLCSPNTTCSTATGLTYSGTPVSDCVTSSTTSTTSATTSTSTTTGSTSTGGTTTGGTTTGGNSTTQSTTGGNSTTSQSTSSKSASKSSNGIIIGFSFVIFLFSFLF